MAKLFVLSAFLILVSCGSNTPPAPKPEPPRIARPVAPDPAPVDAKAEELRESNDALRNQLTEARHQAQSNSERADELARAAEIAVSQANEQTRPQIERLATLAKDLTNRLAEALERVKTMELTSHKQAGTIHDLNKSLTTHKVELAKYESSVKELEADAEQSTAALSESRKETATAKAEAETMTTYRDRWKRAALWSGGLLSLAIAGAALKIFVF